MRPLLEMRASGLRPNNHRSFPISSNLRCVPLTESAYLRAHDCIYTDLRGALDIRTGCYLYKGKLREFLQRDAIQYWLARLVSKLRRLKPRLTAIIHPFNLMEHLDPATNSAAEPLCRRSSVPMVADGARSDVTRKVNTLQCLACVIRRFAFPAISDQYLMIEYIKYSSHTHASKERQTGHKI